jgi:replicative DNA helicase
VGRHARAAEDRPAAQVNAVAEATQTPTDLAGSVALACLSTAAGGKVLVQVDRSWLEQVNLYTVTALPPGSRKSPVFRAMTAPLADAEVALQEAAAEQRIETELAARIAFARAEDLAKKAERATANPQEALADATAAAKEAAEIVVPELPRLMTDDVTPESCISLLATHGWPSCPPRVTCSPPSPAPATPPRPTSGCSSRATQATSSRSTARAASPSRSTGPR